MIPAVALLCAALATQDEERLRVDEADENFLRHWAAALEEGDGQRLRALIEEARTKKADQLYRPDPAEPLWVPLPRALAAKLAARPAKLRAAWEELAEERLSRERDPEARRSLAEAWAAAPAGRDALLALGNEAFDAGELLAAIRAWTPLLELAPTPSLAARMGQAHALRGDARSLAALAERAKAWEGEVTWGGRRRPLAEALAALRAELAPQDGLAPAAPRPDLPLGRLELTNEGKIYGARVHAAMIPEVAGGLVLVNNGIRVLAIDPSKADGGALDVAWRYPKEGFTRYVLPWIHSQGFARPPAGVTVADGRVYANVFTREAREPVRLRRGNQDSFEGPSALCALDLKTGEPLWDTDAMEVYPVEGERVKRVSLFFDRRYVCFSGPPLARGDRLYAPAMSSPRSGRECYVACFRAADGEPLWKTWIASFATSQDVISVTTVAEEDGTLVVASNFGVVAALDTRSGRIEWLRSYLEDADRPGGRRLASPPIIAGGVIYVLAQDATRPLAFERFTGRALPLPEAEAPWEDVDFLAGRSGDWLVFTGRKSFAWRTSDGRVHPLGEDEDAPPGRAALSGGRLYLPTRTGARIYDARSWEELGTTSWAAGTQGGNLALGGGLMAVLGDKLDVCGSEALLAGDAGRRAKVYAAGGRAAEARALFEAELKRLEAEPGTPAERLDDLRSRLEKLGEEKK